MVGSINEVMKNMTFLKWGKIKILARAPVTVSCTRSLSCMD